MRTTSFEGEYFSAGVILTKAHYDYNKKDKGNRLGKTYALKKDISLGNTNQIDKRIWYLVDGKRSFFYWK